MTTEQEIMTIEEFDSINVGEKAKALSCNIPTGIALLPHNLERVESKDKLLHMPTVEFVRGTLRAIGVVETSLEQEGEKFPRDRFRPNMDWVWPTIYASRAAFRPPFPIFRLLDALEYDLRIYFVGNLDKKLIWDVVAERKNAVFKRVHYEGAVFNFRELNKFLHHYYQ